MENLPLIRFLFTSDSVYKGSNNHLRCNSLIFNVSITKHSHNCIFKSISRTNIGYIHSTIDSEMFSAS